MQISNITFDSVYVCRVTYNDPADSLVHRYYVSAPHKIFLQHEITTPQETITVIEKVVGFETH